MKNKEQFSWFCGFEHVDHFGPSGERRTKRCHCRSKKMYDTKEEAAQAGVRHVTHPHSVAVWSTKKGYIGLAIGIHFNAPKTVKVK